MVVLVALHGADNIPSGDLHARDHVLFAKVGMTGSGVFGASHKGSVMLLGYCLPFAGPQTGACGGGISYTSDALQVNVSHHPATVHAPLYVQARSMDNGKLGLVITLLSGYVIDVVVIVHQFHGVHTALREPLLSSIVIVILQVGQFASVTTTLSGHESVGMGLFGMLYTQFTGLVPGLVYVWVAGFGTPATFCPLYVMEAQANVVNWSVKVLSGETVDERGIGHFGKSA